MKKSKKIYYSLLAALFAVALVLGLVANCSPITSKASGDFADGAASHLENIGVARSAYDTENLKAVKSYITATLDAGNVDYEVQSFSLETYNTVEDDVTLFVAREVNNIVVTFAGQSDDAVLFFANYDSAYQSPSALEAAQAAAMLETVLNVKAGDFGTLKNTLIFVFTDGEHEGGLGAHAFCESDLAENVKLLVNFGVEGNGGLTVESDGISTGTVMGLSSSIVEGISTTEQSDYNAFDGVKLNIFSGAGGNYVNTSRDEKDKISKSQLRALGGAMATVIENTAASEIVEKDYVGAFSYLGLSFSYTSAASYVLGGVVSALFICSVVVLALKRKASLSLDGIMVQIMSFIFTALFLVAAYFVIALLLAGFGVIPIHSLVTVKYANAGIVFGGILLTAVVSIGVYIAMRKFYRVKSVNIVKGGALFVMMLGAVAAFALPQYAMPFIIYAILMAITFIIVNTIADSYKEKTGTDIERNLPYVIPAIVATPMIVQLVFTVSMNVAAVQMPLALLGAMLLLCIVTPYFGMLKPYLQKLVSKLPQHNIRVERKITEKVEDKAKKGRFTEVTHKKVTTEKVEWAYHNRYGIPIMALVVSVIIILSAVIPSGNFVTTAFGTYGYHDAYKANSIVYYWKKVSAVTTEKLVVYDQNTYSYVGSVDKAYKWDDAEKAYVKDSEGSVSQILGISTSSPLTVAKKSDDLIEITPYNAAADSIISIVLSNMTYVSKLTLNNGRTETEIENDGNSTVRIEIPYDDIDYATFTIKLEYSRTVNVTVDYTQVVVGNHADLRMATLSDYTDVQNSLDENLNCAIVLKLTNTFSYT